MVQELCNNYAAVAVILDFISGMRLTLRKFFLKRFAVYCRVNFRA
jgi:hypothetical protein